MMHKIIRIIKVMINSFFSIIFFEFLLKFLFVLNDIINIAITTKIIFYQAYL